MTKKKWDFRPEQLRAYSAGGFELIPLNQPGALDDKGRSIGKAPIGRWRRNPPISVAEAMQLMDEEGHNVGVRLRATDLVIDVDPRNFAEGSDPLRQLQDDLGIDLGNAPCVETGSGGLHIYMRKPETPDIRDTLDAYPGIEFKSIGRQVVAAGSAHPGTGKTYLLDVLSGSLADIPEAPRSLLEVIKRPGRLAGASAGKLRDKPEALEEALAFLDAQRDFGKGQHQSWLELMMACHHATAGEGRAEFLAWCATDPEYADKTGEVGRRWDSLHSDGTKNITWRHLFKLVGRSGEAGKNWVRVVDKVPAEEDFPDYDDEGKEDLEDILRSLPEGSRDVSEALEWFNSQGFCAVNDDGKFRIMRQVEDTALVLGDKEEGKSEKPRMRWESMQKPDFLNYYETKRVESVDAKGKTTVEQLAPAWLRWPNRREYEGVVFDPAGRFRKKKLLNLWTDWAVQPKKGDWSLLDKLLLEGLCAGNREAYEYCINWAAFMVQYPDRPAEVAIVFRGEKGTGKGTWFRALTKLCGRHGMHISNQTHFTGHFNAHMRDCIFLFIDEAIWAGDKKAEGELKRLVTEPTLAIEAKGKDVIWVRNHLHCGIASNEHYVVPASLGDERRFQVNDVSSKFKGDHEFFTALNKQLDNGGLQALLWDLKTRDIKDFHPRRGIPKTGALAKQKLAGMEHLDAWWYNCLLTRSLGTDIHPVEGDWGSGKARFLSFDIQQSVEMYLQKAGDRQRMRRSTMTSVGDKFKQNVPAARHIRFMAPKDRLDLGEWVNKDGRTYGYDLPSVDECRLSFEARIGETLQWDLDAVDAEEFVDASVADVQDDFDPLDVDPLA